MTEASAQKARAEAGGLAGLWTVFRREVAAQLDSPMSYIFAIVFVLVSTALYLFLPPFFTFPRADLTGFFGWIVPVLCVFVPAATMRVWAEERKENTIEMLLTFPMSPVALVLGKFLAAYAFFAATLAATWALPVMLAWLGDPDSGPILSGYLAALLLGAFFTALGTFVSSFTRDQVTSFVLSFLACGVVSLVGWDEFSSIMAGSLGWLGSALTTILGMTNHYLPLTRGIVAVADILYFLLWTGLLLFLTGVRLEGRGRPQVVAKFLSTAALALLIGALFNWLVYDARLGWADVTEGRIHTVSESTRKILAGLKVPVQVKLYISPQDKMPPQYREMERDILEKLREMRIASGGMLQPSVIHMEAAELFKGMKEREKAAAGEGGGEDRQKSIEERLADKGVRPFSEQVHSEDQITAQLIYSAIGIAYKEKEDEIIPEVRPAGLGDLEYQIMSRLFKLTLDKRPTIAMVAPVDEMPPEVKRMYMQMGQGIPAPQDRYEFLEKLLEHEKYNVKRVKLTAADPVPDDCDALMVVNPRKLNDRQKWEINRALVAGKPTFIAVQNYRWSPSIRGRETSIDRQNDEPGINDVLAVSGLRIDDRILMDENFQTLTLQSGSFFQRVIIPFAAPMNIIVNRESLNRDLAITSGLGFLFYLWGTAVDVDAEKTKENKLEVTTLVSSSEKAWTVPADHDLTQSDIETPADAHQMTLAVMVSGQFADAYAGKARPPWPVEAGQPPAKDEGPAPPLVPAPGRLILIGCAEMFGNNWLGNPQLGANHVDFFLNSADALTLGDDLLEIRSKKPIERTIEKPSRASSWFWKVTDFGLMSVLLAAAGIARAVVLRRARERYRAAHLRKR